MTIDDLYPNAVKADGFDDCIIGIDDSTFNETPRIVYSKGRMIDTMIRKSEMTWFEAFEYLEFNVWEASIGPQTPIYVNDITGLRR